jgi:hypothetical protein
MEMDERALEIGSGADEDASVAGGTDEAASPALRPRFSDPESWHDLAERGTPRNG